MITIRNHAGFTLAELISVLVLLGIVSVVVLSRFNAGPFQTAGFEQEIRSALRFAQKFAIMSGCEVQVNVNAGTDSYAVDIRNDVVDADTCLSASGAFTQDLSNPTGGVFAGTAPNGVDITAGLSFVYDLQGRPSTGGVIVINGSGITIEPDTGYIH